MIVSSIALATQLSPQRLRVGHEFGWLLRKYQLGSIFTPRLQSKHTLIRLHYLDSGLSGHPLNAGECPGLGMGWVLMYEYSTSLNPLPLQFNHELHMVDAFFKLLCLSRAVFD